MAPQVGLEPTRPFGSPVNSRVQYHYAYYGIELEFRTGIEPVSSA